MNLQCITYFLEVSKTLNFTKAAERLYISQPTLSRQIAELENELGVLLFDRSNRFITLTPFGEFFAEQAQKIVNGCDDLVKLAHTIAAEQKSTLRIGYQSFLDFTIFHKAIGCIREYDATLDFSARKCDFVTMLDLLNKEDLDAGITVLPEATQRTAFCIHHLQSNQVRLVVSKNHPFANLNRPISLNELHNEKFILINNSQCPNTMNSLVNACIKAGFFPNVQKYCKDAQTIQLLVGSGQGISFLFERAHIHHPDDICLLEIADELPCYDLVLIHRKDYSSPALSAFLEEIPYFID